jgi:glycosyltransferase involved in cell wall biosynthesis
VNREQRLKVILIPDTFENRHPTPCGYLRLVLPLTKRVSEGCLSVRLAKLAVSRLDHFDVLITQRLALPTRAAIDEAVALCRARGAKFVYDIDDDLLAIGGDHPDQREYHGMDSVVRHALTCADQVWVTTDEMMRRYCALAREVVVVPNSLDGRIWKSTRRKLTLGEPINFLYMGTASHQNDFLKIVEPAFTRLAAKFQQRVSLNLIGIVPGGQSSDIWTSMTPPAFSYIYPVFAAWLQSLDKFHVGLAPLQDNLFNAAKSNVKWLEYSAMGLATIAADLAPYRDTLVHGKNGLLCSPDPDAWFEAMSMLVQGDGDQLCDLASIEIRQRLVASETHEPRVNLLRALTGRSRELARLDV